MRQDIISQIHSYIREGRLIRRGATVAPELAQQWQCKEYERFPKIKLERRLPTISLGEAFNRRESHLKNTSSHPLTLADIELLFTPLAQKEESRYRYYPSGGALYPIETYLISSFENSESNYLYHYNPKLHVLERLWPTPDDFDLDDLFIKKESSKKIQAAIFFTAVWERSAKKYGDFTYNLALLEAGHMAQNMLLAATELNIEFCPMGGFNDDFVQKILNAKKSFEQIIYSIKIV